MPPNEALQTLIKNLLAATNEGRIQWQETADEKSFRTNFKQGSVKIRIEPDIEDEHGERGFYVLTVHNREGKGVERFRPEMAWEVETCQSLFESARRSAFDADSVIEGIVEELNKVKRG